MSSLKQALQQLPEPTKEIGNMLIEFYETMKALEKDAERGVKQATKIVMTINDFETFNKQFSNDLCIGFVLFIKENNYVLYKDDLWYKKGDYSPLKQKQYFTEQQLLNNYILGLGDLKKPI
jgi:hypothetical protein